MNYNNFFKELSENSSRNFKAQRLMEHSSDEILKNIIYLTLDPFTNFFIRVIPEYKSSKKPEIDFEDILSKDSEYSLSKIYTRKITGYAAIKFLKDVLSKLSEDDSKVLEKIILKDLQCGVGPSTVNKVWPRLIFKYPCMLCENSTLDLIEGIRLPAFVQKKEDGGRVNIIFKDGNIEFYTRNGRLINLQGKLDKHVIDFMYKLDGYVLDGELLYDDGGEYFSRQKGNGILLKAIAGTITEDEIDNIRIVLWDIIKYENFLEGFWDIPYKARFELLQALLKAYVHHRISFTATKDLPMIINLVETHVVHSIEEVEVIFKEYLQKDFEGVVYKDILKPWENKRVKHQLKFKNKLNCELRIKDIVEGKHPNTLGSFYCESEDGIIKVNVGIGFSPKQREEYYDKKYIGQIISVGYNCKILDHLGNYSLFLPRFEDFRVDKDLADTFDEVK